MISYFKKLKILDRIALIIFILGSPFGFYASFIEPFTLKTVTWLVDTKKWPYQHEIKIALLTDTHMIRPWMTAHHLEKIVEETNKLHPDLTLLLGDYVGTHRLGFQLKPEEGLAPLKALSASCGVYAILGNHDLHGSKGWPEALTKTGISVLQNQAVPVNCHGNRFWVAGLEELWWQHADITKTLAQVTDSNPIIMMMHNPDSFPNIPQSVALSVAGHTHGGQVKIPFYGPVASVIPSKYGTRYVYGHIIEEGKDLVVSSGLGMTALPIRFLTPPEISVVTLINSNPSKE